MCEEIIVSINCITYNHEKYIREALDSMLRQKTNFKFEILIHDDASTDKTAEIIKEYYLKYPEIIKPILQEKNQFSKGIKKISYTFNHTRALGKYIAYCEGDDCWVDERKLQKQIDYLEANPNCTFCFHNAIVVNETKKSDDKKKLVLPWQPENDFFFSPKSRMYEAGELQLLGFIPTASFVFPKYILDDPPQWFFDAPAGDNAIKLIASSAGYAFYMDEPMCIYRINVPNSATTKWRESNMGNTIKRCNAFIEMLDAFNSYSNGKYYEEIELAKLTWKVQKTLKTTDGKKMSKESLRKYLKLLPKKRAIFLWILMKLPVRFQLLNVYKKLKNRTYRSPNVKSI